jgi:hypothetical protein
MRLVDNVNGYTIRAGRQLFRFTGMVIGDDGRVKQCSTAATAAGAAAYPAQRARPDADPGLIDAHGHVMGLGFNALQLDLPTPTASQRRRPDRAYAAANPTRAGSSARLEPGTLGLGRFPTAADSMRSSATGRSGWSGSTAMPAGPTASRCARPESPPRPGRRRRPHRAWPARHAAPSGVFVDAAMALVERRCRRRCRCSATAPCARRRRYCCATASPAVADMGTERGGLEHDAPRRRRRP